MTNGIAIAILIAIAALLLVDHQLLHWNIPLLVGREFVRFVEYASFWR